MALRIFCQCIEVACPVIRQSIDLQAFALCVRYAYGLFRRQIRDLTCSGIHLCNVGNILPAAPHPVQRVGCVQLATGFVISHVCKNNLIDHTLIRIFLDHGLSQGHRRRRQVTAAEAIQLTIVIHGIQMIPDKFRCCKYIVCPGQRGHIALDGLIKANPACIVPIPIVIGQ